MKCRGITLKDKQCTRKPEKNSDYCYQHKGQKKHAIENLDRIPEKAQRILSKGPSKTDCEGHIYVYYLLSDERELESYWKIGRTTQGVQKRLSQWPNSKLKASYEVKFNKLAERLIHVIMDDRRIYRYAYTTGKHQTARRFHSVYKLSGKCVMDTQNRQEDSEFKLEGSKKQVEWFICDWRDAKRTVEAVVDYVNNLPRA